MTASPGESMSAPNRDVPERAHEERRATRPGLRRHAVPHPDRRDATGEMLGEPVLPGCEERDRAAAGLAEELVQRRLAEDREADERRVEREADERADRQPAPLPAGVDRDDGDAGREAAEERAELVHGRIIPGTGSEAAPASPEAPRRGAWCPT